MKKERSFRPPQAVLDAVSRFEGEPSVVKLSGSAVPLSDLRKMHSFLRAEQAMEKGDAWDHQGGNAGLMWSRRVLRQEGVLKSSEVGDVFIPEVIDMQLGPNIIAAFAKDDPAWLAEQFESQGIPAAIIANGEGSVAFFSGQADNDYSLEKGLPELPEVSIGEITMIDESRSKLTSIFKAAKDNVTGVQCKRLETMPDLLEAAWEDAYLMEAADFEGNYAKVMKVDGDLGLVLGWAIICTVEDQPYFDKQGDYLPDAAMLEASADFMQNSRVAKEMHVGDEKGSVVFAWPMTAEIAKAFGIEVNQTGLMIAMKPDSEEMLEKFRDGTYNGFSIGGHRISEFTEEVE